MRKNSVALVKEQGLLLLRQMVDMQPLLPAEKQMCVRTAVVAAHTAAETSGIWCSRDPVRLFGCCCYCFEKPADFYCCWRLTRYNYCRVCCSFRRRVCLPCSCPSLCCFLLLLLWQLENERGVYLAVEALLVQHMLNLLLLLTCLDVHCCCGGQWA